MADAVLNTCKSLDSASRVVSSRIRALDSVLEWTDDLAQFSVSQLQLAFDRDASCAAWLGMNAGFGCATFEQQAGRSGTVQFKQACLECTAISSFHFA